jgi:hypothetical protein
MRGDEDPEAFLASGGGLRADDLALAQAAAGYFSRVAPVLDREQLLKLSEGRAAASAQPPLVVQSSKQGWGGACSDPCTPKDNGVARVAPAGARPYLASARARPIACHVAHGMSPCAKTLVHCRASSARPGAVHACLRHGIRHDIAWPLSERIAQTPTLPLASRMNDGTPASTPLVHCIAI